MLAFARRFVPALLTLGSLALAGCGGTYQPGRVASFEVDPAAQIDDGDIQKAFEARPQLGDQLRVAYYTFDAAREKDIEAVLHAVPGVASVYRIPPLMITGQRRFDHGHYGQQKEVTVKKLRLFAARARADVLVVVDHGYRTGGVNGLAAFSGLLVPALFLPFLDNTVEGYADAFVIDVRNGYLYGHVTESDKRGDPYATIYDKNAAVVAEEQWATLRDDLKKDLVRLVADERARRRETGAAGPKVAAGARSGQ